MAVNITRNIDMSIQFSTEASIATIAPRGIIIPAMEKYEHLLISNISYLRNRLKCTLPIEIWQIGQEISDRAQEKLASKRQEWNLSFKDIRDCTDDPEHWRGYQIKPFILKYTAFKEVILCDCDTVFLTNPEIIFYDPHYITTGTFFFKDYLLHTPKTTDEEVARKAYFRRLMPRPSKYLPEECQYLYDIPTEKQQLWYYQESGVVYINKESHPEVIDVIYDLNYKHEETYQYVHGDKETYWMAFLMLDKPFYMNFIPGLNLMPHIEMPRIRGPIADNHEKLVPAFTHLYIINNKYVPFFSQKAYPDYEHLNNTKIFDQLKKCSYYADLFVGKDAYTSAFSDPGIN